LIFPTWARFLVRGCDALRFLQHSSTNNVQALDKPETGAQYTLIPNETGGAVDDAYLYRFVQDEYLLVVNAANCSKDRNHFQAILSNFEEMEFLKVSQDVAMLTLQSSNSRRILNAVLQSGHCLNRCAMLSVSLALTAVRSKSPGPVIPLSHWALNCPYRQYKDQLYGRF